MSQKCKKSSPKPKDYFLKGFLLGMGATALAAGIGAFVAWQIVKSKDSDKRYRKLYSYSLEGGILPDTDLDDTSPPAFKDASEKLEKEYEAMQKAQAETEEVARHLREII
jgi:hypothetical protein